MAGDDYGPAVLASMWSMFSLASVIVGLRVYTRLKHSNFGYDDCITLMCWVVFLATAIPITTVVSWGFGKHIYDIPVDEQPRAREGQVIGTACVILIFASPKFGNMATVQRATNPPSGFWQRVFYTNWVMCTASFIFLFAVSIFQFMQCKPVAYQWELTGRGHCIDTRVNIMLAYASTAFSTVLDFYFSILPATIIWKLQMSSRNRAVMSVVLGGASFATIVSIIKMWKLGNAISQIAEDPTYAMCEIYILVYVETTLLIVGSSIAAVLPLLRSMNVRLWGISGNGGTASHGASPLRTFGRGPSKRRRDLVDDDELTLTRGGTVGDTSNISLGGIVKTTDVNQTWGPAHVEPQSAARQLGLNPGML